MEPAGLIALFTAIFVVTFVYIWKRDVLFGGVYFFLYVYTIFAQIGYAYFPWLSSLIKAYFGPEVFYEVNLFVTLSFFSLFMFFFLCHHILVRRPAYSVTQSKPNLRVFFYLFVIGHLLGMALYFSSNYEFLNYSNVSDEEFQAQQGISFLIFMYLFKLSTMVNLILYFLLRVRVKIFERINRFSVFVLLLLEVALFITISAKLGSRTDPFALTLAIVILELSLARTLRQSKWILLKTAVVVGVVLYGLTIIEESRTSNNVELPSLAESLLYKDYYSPSHILIASMALHYIDPVEVIKSNSSNALFKLNHPYLQATVADLFNPGVSTRSSSYAFYLFSEGYLALGWFGIVYNGLIVFLGIALWRTLANSNNHYYNLFLISLVATQLANIVRSQSSYFVKDIYIFFIPAIVLFFLATGLRPRLGHALGPNSSASKPGLPAT